MRNMIELIKDFFRKKSQNEDTDLASLRRARFINSADSSYSQIPVPSENEVGVKITNIRRPDGWDLGFVEWETETNEGKKYLYTELTARDNGAYDSDHWVVMVKSRYFYAIWRAGFDQPFGDPSYPPKVEEIFGNGSYGDYDRDYIWTKENPVKIPKIGPDFALYDYCHLGFTNGRHRVLWLISKGATVFPVEVRTQEAALKLHDLVGMEGYAPERLLTFHGEFSGV